MKKYSPDWTLVPPDIKVKIKAEDKGYRVETVASLDLFAKHKYVCILGASPGETKYYRRLFKKLNPKKVNLP